MAMSLMMPEKWIHNNLEKQCNDLAKSGLPLKAENLINTVQVIIVADQRPTPFLNGGRKQGFSNKVPLYFNTCQENEFLKIFYNWFISITTKANLRIKSLISSP